ncbi:hypothetical protein BY458DRAFT_526832 [Sporodiniella umbellata]|nr:hypothetical protein BY458DRAFT_526832 [Sporodiniella umbellata]
MYHIKTETEYSQAANYPGTPASLLDDMLNSNKLLEQKEADYSSNIIEYDSGFSMPSSSLSTFSDLNLEYQDVMNFNFPQQGTVFDSLSPQPDVDHVEFNTLPWSNEGGATLQYKRSFSQQPEEIMQECPLPMSGVSSRKMSVVTDSDISTWKRMLEDHPSKKKKTVGSIKEAESFEEYPIITEADMKAAKADQSAIPRRQNLRHEGDKYTPKWVRYTGQLKEGYCDTCDQGKWLQLKNSAYWYHKQFYHGISSISGYRFHDPISQRQRNSDILEGLCHQCREYVPVSNMKRKNSVLWYRHAHKCHIYNRLKPKSGVTKRGSTSVHN